MLVMRVEQRSTCWWHQRDFVESSACAHCSLHTAHCTLHIAQLVILAAQHRSAHYTCAAE